MSVAIASLADVEIERLGQRGEGVTRLDGHRLFVPYALPGERVRIDHDGERCHLVSVMRPSPDRIDPICTWFGTCGGCAVQALAEMSYAAWKRDLLIDALAHAHVKADVAPLVAAHGAGRRRVTFHSRVEIDGRLRLGFMQARSHAIVSIDACPILDSRLDGALDAVRAVAQALAPTRTPLDLIVAATDTGMDLDLRGHGKLNEGERARLVQVGIDHNLARLSNHGVIVVETCKPTLQIGEARVEPPPGAFLQATLAGEAALAARVTTALAGAKRVADLFAGLGTFALRLAEKAEVTAIDMERPALAAIDRAARTAPMLRRVTTEARDLFQRPLVVEELNRFDALVLDPPRAGAEAQMRAIAASEITRVVSVACDVQTFARDAAILLSGGFEIDRIDPIDQFRYSAHLEIVAPFRRPAKKRKRRLLG